tara:strand:+ start:840 stop:1013 length:174 start_codon:yes stop_codon:yes gene_type:complete
MIDEIFNICMYFLYDVADFLGTSYEAVNVWFFCVIEPIVFILMVLRIINLKSLKGST